MTPKEQALAAIDTAAYQKAIAAISAACARDCARLTKAESLAARAAEHVADAWRYATQAAAAYACIKQALDNCEEFAVECDDYQLCAQLAEATRHERAAKDDAKAAAEAAATAEAAAARL